MTSDPPLAEDVIATIKLHRDEDGDWRDASHHWDHWENVEDRFGWIPPESSIVLRIHTEPLLGGHQIEPATAGSALFPYKWSHGNRNNQHFAWRFGRDREGIEKLWVELAEVS